MYNKSRKITYIEKLLWPDKKPIGPVEACLILRVKTTMERIFPIKPKIETEVRRKPSMIRVEVLRSSMIPVNSESFN